MFELESTSPFFEQLAQEEPLLVQNIELVHENKMQLDISYHNPKRFILNLNNLLRSTLFFVETSIKNTPHWLKNEVDIYRNKNVKEYEILKYLRNISAHQALIFPEESLISGLYRIRSEIDYKLKLGLGDHDKPQEYSRDLALKNTQDIFHDILVFQNLAFMDLEHSSLGECLGITRKWFFDVKIKKKSFSFSGVIDVYHIVCTFATQLLDRVCEAYAGKNDIKFSTKFSHEFSEYNFINTILEIDLYPSLFSEWWEGNIEPLNFGTLAERNEGDKHWLQDQWHKYSYSNLCDNAESYKTLLIKYSNLSHNEYFEEKNLSEFTSFVNLNHWHLKKAFNAHLTNTPFNPSEIMKLQRLGKIFISEYKKQKLCSIQLTCESFKEHLSSLVKKLD